MDSLVQDLRFGIRMLLKRPVSTATSVGTLALGIGAATAIFSVVYGVLLRPLPYPRPDRLVRVWEQAADGHRMNLADPNFEDLRAQSRSLDGVAEYAFGPSPVVGGSEPVSATLAFVSRDFFSVMRVEPERGRGLTAGDHRPGAAPVAVVSRGFWRRVLGGRTDLASLRLNAGEYTVTVVGVLPAEFSFPGGSEIWVPREIVERLPSRSAHNWPVVGRLRDGVSLGAARAELATIGQRLQRRYGGEVDCTALAVAPLQDALTGSVERPLLVLLAAVGMLLLIAGINVANLCLAQSTAREAELAVRSALGAPRRRLVRQFLTEAAVLAASAGLLGVALARGGLDALLALAPAGMPRLADVAIDRPVLLFSLGTSVLLALGLGGFAALRATAADPRQALAERGRSGAGSLRVTRVGRVLVAGQLALALVLLVGAGLLGRSLLRVLAVEPGFRTDHVLTLDLTLPGVATPAERAARVRFLDELSVRLRRLPAVEEVGVGTLPLASWPANGTFLVLAPGTTVAPSPDFLERAFREWPSKGDADYCPVSGGYFRALGIPLRRGRLFEEGDREDTPHAALVNESLARVTWPDRDPLGQVLEFGNMDGDLRPLTVVGVVGDVRGRSLEDAPRPTVYVDLHQRPHVLRNPTVVVYTHAEPFRLIPDVRELVRSLDPTVVATLGSFRQVVASSLQARRFHLMLVGAFAAVALLLAAAGLYATMSYAVAQRRVEIGIRMALGADPSRVRRLVLGQGLRTTVAGVGAGALGALLLARALGSLLFSVTPLDPATFVAVALGLTAVALLAAWLPAREASRVEPGVILRHD
jgi:putative ABC transport system permease protein